MEISLLYIDLDKSHGTVNSANIVENVTCIIYEEFFCDLTG
jgi:hypothetical protein